MAMTQIVLRVRLTGGEHSDITHGEDGGMPDEVGDPGHLDPRGR
jgi:hypothetical protein